MQTPLNMPPKPPKNNATLLPANITFSQLGLWSHNNRSELSNHELEDYQVESKGMQKLRNLESLSPRLKLQRAKRMAKKLSKQHIVVVNSV